MKSRLFRSAGLGLLIFVLSACNYPGIARSTPLPPAPNLTLTALFGATQLPNTGGTQFPELPTTTPVPFDTAIPTEVPTQLPTNTQVATLAPATPTQAATLAPTATVSLAGPGQRDNAAVSAFFFTQKPVIDGDFGEWQADKYRVDRVVFGRENWKDEQDLWARVMFGWDAANFYIAVRVRDDRYVQNSTPERMFEGDSLELLLDIDVASDFYQQSLSSDDVQIGISPGERSLGRNLSAYLWYPRQSRGELHDMQIVAVQNDDGYRVEVAIPWGDMGVRPETGPKIGQHFGFAFSVSDNDNPDKNLQQSMVSIVPKRVLTDPTTWGDLSLQPAP